MEISKSYTKVEWREDLKLMLRKCGADPGYPGVFLFSDTQITDEGFVEDINNLLNSGEVITSLFLFYLCCVLVIKVAIVIWKPAGSKHVSKR